MADQGLQYLKIDTQEAFNTLEEIISDGYSRYGKINQEVGKSGYKDQGKPVPDDLMAGWQKNCDEWRNEAMTKLTATYASTNYADEFVLANHSAAFQTTSGPINSMFQDLLGSIRKLEQYRNRLLSKSTLIINNSGHFNFQAGSHNSNEQGTQ